MKFDCTGAPCANAESTPRDPGLSALRILVVEDNEDDARLTVRQLEQGGLKVTWERVETFAALREALGRGPWDIVLADYKMPSFDGLAALNLVREVDPDLPFILISGTVGEEIAVEAMRAGAHDYLMKDNLTRLVPAVERELKEAERRRAHRAADNALRASEMMNRSLLEDSPICMKIIDLDSKLRYMSTAGQKKLKIPDVTAYYGQTYPPDFCPESMRPLVIESLNQAMAGTTSSVEAAAHDTEGNELWFHTTFVPALDDDGRVKYVIGASVDITERKQAEEELKQYRDHLEEMVAERTREIERQRRELEKANRLKSEFLSTMSHELRTPLNSVLVLSELMLKRGTGRDTEKEAEYLRVIERNGHHLLELINDILDLSRIEAGRMELWPREFAASTVLTRALEIVEPLAEQKGLPIETRLEGSPRLYSDEDRVKQILVNLLNNAVKFTKEGSVTATVTEDGGQVFFSVTDSGIGISEPNLSQIFESFRQIDGSSTREYGGTGMGLAISRRLARLLGGDLTARSELGRGSTFTLVLPLRMANPATPS